jgi:hypothetical protein
MPKPKQAVVAILTPDTVEFKPELGETMKVTSY